MHGPGGDLAPWWTPGWGPNIRLIDDVLNTIPRSRIRKRKRWRTALAEAIHLWEQAGITFDVEVGPGVKYTYFNPEAPRDHYLYPLVVPGTVRLVRNLYHPNEDIAWYRADIDGAIAAVKLTDWFMGENWRESDIPVRVRVTAHEIGHCLGLSHGGTHGGLMNGGPVPNEHDLESVRSYYLAS